MLCGHPTSSADAQQAADPFGTRWRGYDARARVALRCMAGWLRVPWAKVESLERLRAVQVSSSARGRCMLLSCCLGQINEAHSPAVRTGAMM